MNERIRELAGQCGAYHKDDEGEETKIAVLIGKEVEKFAELIVKECLHIVDDEGAGEGGCIRAMIRIQEEFGVEA